MGLCNIGGKDGYLRKMIADKLVALGVTTAKAYDSASKFVTNIQTAVTNADTAGYNRGVSATKQGTASEGQVLDGYTFTNQSGLKNGSMPNRGALNWNPSTNTTYTVPAGYYSGGTLNSANAYNAGKSLAKNVVMKSYVCTMGGSYDNYSGSFTIDSGYTLNRTVFLVPYQFDYTVYSGGQGASISGTTTCDVEQSGTTINVYSTRFTRVWFRAYYLNTP